MWAGSPQCRWCRGQLNDDSLINAVSHSLSHLFSLKSIKTYFKQAKRKGTSEKPFLTHPTSQGACPRYVSPTASRPLGDAHTHLWAQTPVRTPAGLAEPQAVSTRLRPTVLRPQPQAHLALGDHLRQRHWRGPLLLQVLADPKVLLHDLYRVLQLLIPGAQLLLLLSQQLGSRSESAGPGGATGPRMRSTPSFCPSCAAPSNTRLLSTSGSPG